MSEDICMVPGLVDIVQLPCPGHRFTGSPECVLPNSIYQLDSSEGSYREVSTHHLYHWYTHFPSDTSHALDQGAQIIGEACPVSAACPEVGAYWSVVCPAAGAYWSLVWAPTEKELTAITTAITAATVTNKMMRFTESPLLLGRTIGCLFCGAHLTLLKHQVHPPNRPCLSDPQHMGFTEIACAMLVATNSYTASSRRG